MEYPKQVNKAKFKAKEPSLRELHEYMKKMRQKGFQGHLKGGRGRVRPIYEDD